MEVSDDGPGFDRSSITPGHGLDNLQDRLASLFEGAGRFEILRRDGKSVAMIALPAKIVTIAIKKLFIIPKCHS